MDCPVKTTCVVFQNICQIYQDNAKLQAKNKMLEKMIKKDPPRESSPEEDQPTEKHYAGNPWNDKLPGVKSDSKDVKKDKKEKK